MEPQYSAPLFFHNRRLCGLVSAGAADTMERRTPRGWWGSVFRKGDRLAVSLKGKVVLITGATGQIGRRLVNAFADSEARLALCVRRVSDVDPIERPLLARGVDVSVFPCDIRFEEDVVRMIHRVARRFGRIDVVVNGARAAAPRLNLTDYPVDPWRNVLATNVTGPFLVCREVLPWMIRQNEGSIINVSHGLGSGGRPDWAPHFIAAHATEGLSRLLLSQLRGTKVRVNTIEIGPPHHEGQFEKADGWTDAFLWLAGMDSASVSGQVIRAAEYIRSLGNPAAAPPAQPAN